MVGAGYVGLSLAVLLSQKNEVKVLDIIKEKVDLINNKKAPIVDKEIEDFLANKELNLTATTDAYDAYKDSEYVIIATPTDYDPEKNYFNTSSIENVISTLLPINPNAVIVIKSTIPIGYTKQLKEKYNTNNIIFSPEFLREGKYMITCPSRIIIEQSGRAKKFADLLLEGAVKKEVPVCLYSTEAEAIKYLQTHIYNDNILMNWILCRIEGLNAQANRGSMS